MATTTLTNRFREYCLNGDLDFGADVIRMALYNGSGHDAATSAYTATAEVVGTGYTAKGEVMASVSIVLDAGTSTAYVDWDNVAWSSSTITSTDCMIYHDSVTAPAADPASYIGDFGGSRSSSAGTFTVTLPGAAPSTAIIRIA